MATGDQLRVGSLHRHPVKSMLGEALTTLTVGGGGAETGRVASAKQARLWHRLLQCTAVSLGDPFEPV